VAFSGEAILAGGRVKLAVEDSERGDGVRLVGRAAIDPFLVTRVAVHVTRFVAAGLARAGIKVAVEGAQREREECVTGLAAIGPCTLTPTLSRKERGFRAVVVNAELQLAEAGLRERDAGVGLERQMKAAMRAKVVLAEDVAGNVVSCFVSVDPGCDGEFTIAQVKDFVVRDFEPRRSAVEAGDS
jgi:hypothetical protein